MPELDFRPITELDFQPYEESETSLDLQKIEEQAKDTLRLADETEYPVSIVEDLYEPIKGDEKEIGGLFRGAGFTGRFDKIGLKEQIKRMDASDWAARVPFSPQPLVDMATLHAAVRRLKKDDYETAPIVGSVGTTFELATRAFVPYLPPPESWTPTKQRDADIKLVEDYFLKMAESESRGMTFGAKVFNGATYLPAWMIEFALTGGLAKMGNTAAKEVAAKTLQGYAKTKAGQIVLKGAGWTGSAITRATIGMPHRIGKEILERRIPEKMSYGKDGEFEFDINPESPMASIFKGWLSVVISVASEQSGEGLTYGAKTLAMKTPFGRSIVNALSKLKPGESVNRFFTRAGWSNYLGEFGEEAVEVLLQGICDTEDFGTGPDSTMIERLNAGIGQFLNELPVTAAVLALPGGVRYAAGKVIKQTDSEKNQETLDAGAQEATEASRQYLNRPASKDLAEEEPDIGFIKNILHNLGIKDKGDYQPLSEKDFRDIYKFIQMPFDIGLTFPQFKPIYETQRARESAKLNLDTHFAKELQPYYSLDKTKRAKVDAALCEADRNPGILYGPKNLKDMGLDKEQINAFLAVRTSFDEAFYMLTDRMEKAGMDEAAIEEFKAKAGNYIPHKWYGNWAVIVKEKMVTKEKRPIKKQAIAEAEAFVKGKEIPPVPTVTKELKRPRTVFMTKTNYADRFKERDRLRKLYPDADVIIMKANKIPYQAFQESAPWAVGRMVDMVIERSQASPETAAAMREALTDLYKSKGFGMHYVKRKDIPGYIEDLARSISEYFAGFSGYITKMQAIQEFSENITAINPQRTPNLYKYALDYIKYVTGDQMEFAKAKRIAYAYYLFGNIKSASLNLTQNLTLGWPVLSKHTNFALPKILQAQARTIHPIMLTQNEKKFLTDLEKAGHLQPQLSQEISGYTKNPLMQGIRTKAGKVVNFLDIFRHIESFNRRAMAVALYDSGITNIEKAGEIIKEAHFYYGKGNRPVLARGYISPVMTFRSWGINYFTWLKNEIKAGNVAPEAKSLAAIVFLGGLKALPFASLFIWAWRKIFGTDPESDLRNAIGKTAGQLVMRGAPSQIGVSFTGSISPMDVPSPDEINTFEKTIIELGGVFADIPARAARVSKSLAVKDYSRALEDASPEVLRNPLAAYRLYEEGARSRNGRVILDLESGEPLQMTTKELITKTLGYQPVRMAEQYDVKKALDQFYGERMKLKQNWADRYWLAFLNDDIGEMSNITQEIVNYNERMKRRNRDEDIISIDEMDDMLTTRARPLNIPASYVMPKYKEILNKFYQRKFQETD